MRRQELAVVSDRVFQSAYQKQENKHLHMVFVLFSVSALWLTSPPPDGTETLDGSPNRIIDRGELTTKTMQRSCTIWNETGYLQSLVGFMNNHHQNIFSCQLGGLFEPCWNWFMVQLGSFLMKLYNLDHLEGATYIYNE